MRRLPMGNRANDAYFIEDLGDLFKLGSDILARDTFDGTERPPILRGSKGLRVPGLMLGDAPRQIDVDDGGGDGLEGLHRWQHHLACLHLQQIREGQPKPRHCADLEEITSPLGGGEEIAVVAGAETMHFHGVKSEKVQSEPTLGSHRYYDLHPIPQVWRTDAQFPHNQPPTAH